MKFIRKCATQLSASTYVHQGYAKVSAKEKKVSRTCNFKIFIEVR
jgi:hypothetical protein